MEHPAQGAGHKAQGKKLFLTPSALGLMPFFVLTYAEYCGLVPESASKNFCVRN
jgi:hypothetical protein